MSYPPQRRRVVAAAPRRQPAELRAVRVVFEPDPDVGPGALNLEHRRDDWERGELEFMTAHAEAEVSIGGTDQVLYSPGVSGIESDAEDSRLDEIIDGEWAALRGVLKAVGVSTDQLPLTVEREWIEWRK